MSEWNIAAKAPEDQVRVAVDLAASGVAYKERLNIPVVPELVAREQPEALRTYFNERLAHYRTVSRSLPVSSDPRYLAMSEANAKNNSTTCACGAGGLLVGLASVIT